MPEKFGRSSRHRKISTRETRSKSHGPHHRCRPLKMLQHPGLSECGEEKCLWVALEIRFCYRCRLSSRSM